MLSRSSSFKLGRLECFEGLDMAGRPRDLMSGLHFAELLAPHSFFHPLAAPLSDNERSGIRVFSTKWKSFFLYYRKLILCKRQKHKISISLASISLAIHLLPLLRLQSPDSAEDISFNKVWTKNIFYRLCTQIWSHFCRRRLCVCTLHVRNIWDSIQLPFSPTLTLTPRAAISFGNNDREKQPHLFFEEIKNAAACNDFHHSCLEYRDRLK